MANTPQLLRPPEFTNEETRNLHYVIEQAAIDIAVDVLDETPVEGTEEYTYANHRKALAELVIGLPSRALEVIQVAIGKLWDSPTFNWDDVTNAQVKTHMENAWTSCARGKFPALEIQEVPE
ncbi:hypothetical protein N9X87_00085 [bacterium]|nr:hypothetical protein [bacterium]